jgi:hypothetical protein
VEPEPTWRPARLPTKAGARGFLEAVQETASVAERFGARWHTPCTPAQTGGNDMLEPKMHRDPGRPREPEIPAIDDPPEPDVPKVPEMPPPTPDPPDVVGRTRGRA